MNPLKKIICHLRGFIMGFKWYFTTTILPNIPSQTLKNRFLRILGAQITRNVKFYNGFSVRNPRGLFIEDGVNIGPKVLLDARCGIRIRKSAVIAYDAIIWTLNHDYNDIHFCTKGAPVDIGAYAWICSRSIILPGITIGEGAIVASGAIVTKNVPPYAIVAGIPAKIVGYREKQNWDYGYSFNNDYNHFV